MSEIEFIHTTGEIKDIINIKMTLTMNEITICLLYLSISSASAVALSSTERFSIFSD